jgi:hypothetical protein
VRGEEQLILASTGSPVDHERVCIRRRIGLLECQGITSTAKVQQPVTSGRDVEVAAESVGREEKA